MRVLKTTAAVLFLAAVSMIVFDSRVHSQGSEQELAADQANVAATKDATYTSGSVDLEGVPEDDKTTYTFKTDDDPPAINISPDSLPDVSPVVRETDPEGATNWLDGELIKTPPEAFCTLEPPDSRTVPPDPATEPPA